MLLSLAIALAFASRAFSDPIHSAAEKGDLAKVTSLIKGDPSLVSAKDKMGMTPLHVAARNDHKDVAEFLLANGADINAKDSNGEFTPLDLALSCYHYMDVVELLVAKGADVNARSKQGLTPLQETAMRGQKDAAELLLTKGADVNARDEKGDSPLLWALMMGHMDFAKILVDAGADVNAKSGQGVTPLLVVQRRSDSKMEDYLRQHGAR
jgi:cytohesin